MKNIVIYILIASLFFISIINAQVEEEVLYPEDIDKSPEPAPQYPERISIEEKTKPVDYESICKRYIYDSIPKFKVTFTENYWWRWDGNRNPHILISLELFTSLNRNFALFVVPFDAFNLKTQVSDETDLNIFMRYKGNFFTIDLGGISYDGRGINHRPEYGEIYFGSKLNFSFKNLSIYPSFKVFFALKGKQYMEGMVISDIGNTSGKVYLTLSGLIGYDFGQILSDGSDFTVFVMRFDLNWNASPSITVSPNFSYAFPIKKATNHFTGQSIFSVDLVFKI